MIDLIDLTNLLDPIGGETTITASATLVGAGSLTAAVTLGYAAAGTLAAAGDLTAGTALGYTVAGTLTGAGDLSAAATLDHAAAATLTAAGTLTGTGNLSAVATLGYAAAATLTGTGNLTTALEMDSGTALDLLQYLDSLFADGTVLATTFPGGVHFNRNEPGRRTRPYVTVDLLSDVPTFASEDDEPAQGTVQVQFTIAADSLPEARTLGVTLTTHATEGLDRIKDVDLGGGVGISTVMRTNLLTTLDAAPNPDGGEAALTVATYLFLLTKGA